MTYQDISTLNVTSEGADGILCFVHNNVPEFFAMFLFAFYMILLITLSIAQSKARGRVNFFASSAVAGFLTFVLSVLFTLSTVSCSSLINIFTLGISFTVMLVSAVLFLFTKDQ